MEANRFQPLYEKQQAFFYAGKSRSLNFRMQALKKLRSAILMYEEEIYEALFQDLHKSKFEAYATEIGFVLEELSFHLKKLKKWMKPVQVSTPFTSFPAKSYYLHEPLGTILIISPWNYPFQLMMAPLIGAIAAGNTVIIKPSEIAEHTAKVIERLINSTFDKDYVHVINGGADVSQELLKLKFNHVFFTGSPHIGRLVMQAAANNLVPVTLELGGKSPCIVDKNVDLALAARRIVWGKLLNAGQTCIAPDYLLVHESIKDQLIQELIGAITRFYGKDIENNPEYPHIISKPNMERLKALLQGANIVFGGHTNMESKYFEPTILDRVNFDLPVMQQEIFGPIFPVLSYTDEDEMIRMINGRERPLALYIFSNNTNFQHKMRDAIPAGGVSINDTLMHIVSNKMPFGGIGNSGMGQYHGYFSFETFSHKKAVVKRGTWLDVPIRYAPFKNKLRIIKYLMH
jgi:aldehyde dehydrogenase (NAD+)